MPSGADQGEVVVAIGPRRFGGRRDVAILAAFVAAFAATLVVAARAGLPGVIGSVYVATGFAVWVQDFRRCWRISAERVEVRRWRRWQSVDRADVASILAASDELGLRAIALTGDGEVFEIPVDDVRVEPLLASAVARFVEGCRDDGAVVDPVVPPLLPR